MRRKITFYLIAVAVVVLITACVFGVTTLIVYNNQSRTLQIIQTEPKLPEEQTLPSFIPTQAPQTVITNDIEIEQTVPKPVITSEQMANISKNLSCINSQNIAYNDESLNAYNLLVCNESYEHKYSGNVYTYKTYSRNEINKYILNQTGYSNIISEPVSENFEFCTLIANASWKNMYDDEMLINSVVTPAMSGEADHVFQNNEIKGFAKYLYDKDNKQRFYMICVETDNPENMQEAFNLILASDADYVYVPKMTLENKSFVQSSSINGDKIIYNRLCINTDGINQPQNAASQIIKREQGIAFKNPFYLFLYESTTNNLVYACEVNSVRETQIDIEEDNTYFGEKLISGYVRYYKPASYTEEDIEYLAQVIYHENYWNGEYIMALTGSVVINRSYWNKISIKDVIYAKGQYATVDDLFTVEIPDSVYAIAEDLLKNGTVCPQDVYFQAMFPQGSGIYYEENSEYFCYK